MISPSADGTVGVLVSGGLDSCILLHQLADEGQQVQPFYITSGLCWQAAELAALDGFLRETARPELKRLVKLDLPLADVYDDHWSITGRGVPAADTPDDAVYLPGRNALLMIKAALWCRLRGIGSLALASLANNPFADASSEFFRQFEAALSMATEGRVGLLRPLAALDKRQVMELGSRLPLELTFSCIAPVGGLHCGRCNKCQERRAAFHLACLPDGTAYAASGQSAGARSVPSHLPGD